MTARGALEVRVREAMATARQCTAKHGSCSFCDEAVAAVLRSADVYVDATIRHAAAAEPEPEHVHETAWLRQVYAAVVHFADTWRSCWS